LASRAFFAYFCSRESLNLGIILPGSSHLGEQANALDILSRSISNGFFCYSAMVRDPWLDSLCACEGFVALLRKAQELHLESMKSFLAAGGDSLLRVSPENL
jgi:hypothetical protein